MRSYFQKSEVNKKMKQKKAVSLMLSYVLLVGIVVGLAIIVWGVLKYWTDISPPVDCEEGTSLILIDYDCSIGGGLSLTLRNNGRFSVKGFILTVGNDSNKEPLTYLISQKHIGQTGMEGFHEFSGGVLGGELKPTDDEEALYTHKCRSGSRGCQTGDIDFSNNRIEVMKIQPYIELKRNKIVCKDSVIKQLVDCPIIT